MSYLLLVCCAIAFLYQMAAIAAAIAHRLRRQPAASSPSPVSILKPVRGLDPGFFEALRSHAAQDHPDFEILFGAAGLEAPAVAEIEGLAREFPEREIRVIRCQRATPNGKVGVLAELVEHARHSLLVVNDSDIRVPPDYLRNVLAPLADPRVGLVTCLYRAAGDTWAARWEALTIAADFAPGVLVAPLVGVRNTGLGATLAFRAADLARIGGFDAFAEYLADDHQLARRIAGSGLRVHLSPVVVETTLQADTWAEAWRHQLRWHRTVRTTNFAGYLGLPVTFATLWSLAAAAAGWPGVALALLVARLAAALLVGAGLLHCPVTRRWWPLIPVRDLSGLALWLHGLLGCTVEWRGLRLRLDRRGRIVGRSG